MNHEQVAFLFSSQTMVFTIITYISNISLPYIGNWLLTLFILILHNVVL